MTRQEEDERAIMDWLTVAGPGPAFRLWWFVFRRGSPRRPVRVLKATPREKDARRKYDEVRAAMRQGSVALVAPLMDGLAIGHQIVEYASEPMARSRW